MDKRALSTDLHDVLQANERFFNKWKDEISGFLVKEDPTANESLSQELLADILEHIRETAGLIRYREKKVCRAGLLSTDSLGNILLGGKRLPPLEEFEVYLYDDILKKKVWTRTFVTMTAQGEAPRLAGVEMNTPVNGIHARARW